LISRVLGIIGLLAALALLFYLLQVTGSRGGGETAATVENTEPGFAAIHAQLIQTGDDGQPLYQLTADRIDQRIPGPQGDLVLTEPRLNYQPVGGNPWNASARHGTLPPGEQLARLNGDVLVSGKPQGSQSVLRIRTTQLDVDMKHEVATSAARVDVDWAGARLSGVGLYADLKSTHLRLQSSVHGSFTR
jgi:lipopolysaccharide export system protein LptC